MSVQSINLCSHVLGNRANLLKETSVWSKVTLVWGEVALSMERSDFWWGRNYHGAK